jgi:hypothetical protein
MNSTKMIQPKLNLSKKSDGKLSEYTSQCINCITENAVAFNKMSPSISELNAAYDTFKSAMEQCGRQGNPANTAAKDQARVSLCNTLTWCANSCSEIADTDTALFELSGFSVRSKATRINSINCPTNVNVEFGPMEGSVYCSFESVAYARCYEISYGTNPNDTSGWSKMTVSTSRKTLITDLTPMSKAYLCIRTIGPRNIISDWCPMIAFKIV